MDWLIGRVVDQSHCRPSVVNTRVNNFVFAINSVILAKSLKVSVMASKALHETKPLELKVSQINTKSQVFEDLLDKKYNLFMDAVKT